MTNVANEMIMRLQRHSSRADLNVTERQSHRRTVIHLFCALATGLSACSRSNSDVAVDSVRGAIDTVPRIAMITGLAGPESVRYDPDQDVYFVGNFNGSPVGDANGFVSRVVAADGRVDSLRFMTGPRDTPLHGPRGMFIVGDTLWVVDALGVHGFHRRTGAHLAFVNLASLQPGFPNDIARGADGALYVTDTDSSRIYRIAGGRATVVVADSTIGMPNGIAWQTSDSAFILAPWGGSRVFRRWRPNAPQVLQRISSSAGGFFDGVEIFDGLTLVASQQDSAIHILDEGGSRQLLRVLGEPADIGIDTRRRRLAVPYVELNRVDIWVVPQRAGG